MVKAWWLSDKDQSQTTVHQAGAYTTELQMCPWLGFMLKLNECNVITEYGTSQRFQECGLMNISLFIAICFYEYTKKNYNHVHRLSLWVDKKPTTMFDYLYEYTKKIQPCSWIISMSRLKTYSHVHRLSLWVDKNPTTMFIDYLYE